MAEKVKRKKRSEGSIRQPASTRKPGQTRSTRKNIKKPFDPEHRQLLSIFDSIDEVIYIADPDTYEVLYANESLRKLLGNVKGEKCHDAFQGIKSPCLFCTNKYIFGKNLGKSYVWEFRNRKNQRWYHCIDKAIRWPGGKMVRYEMAIDITDRQLAEESLHESERLYRTLAEAAQDAIFIIGRDDTVKYVNTSAARLFGKSPEEITGKPRALLFPPEIASEQLKTLLKVFDTGAPQYSEGRIPFPQATIWISTVLAPLVDKSGEVYAVLGISRDITASKKAEERLRESEEKYRDLYDNAPDMYYTIDRNGIITECNDAHARMLGYTKEEIIGRPLPDFFTEESRRLFYQNFPKLNYIKSRLFAERDFVRKDGSVFTASININSQFDHDGEFSGTKTIARDITEMKHAEEALKSRENFLINILDSIQDGLSILDRDMNIIRVNPIMEKWYSHKMPLVGKKCYEAYHGLTVPCKTCPTLRTFKSGEADHETVTYIGPSGAGGYMDVYTFPLTETGSGEMVGVIEYVRDVSERIKLERELLKMEKLESVGILAGGIAHDFNNILTAIMGNIAIAMMYTKPGHELFARLVEAEKASLRARDLTQQLLTFSKGGAPVRKMTSIAEIIKDSAAFALRGSNVKCTFSFSDNLWPAEIDEGQMSQVINNLVINADHAMPDGGTVEISAENLKGEELGSILSPGKRYLKVMIADEGVGIPQEYIQKIFDPYFTTKEKGNGLGLAITYSIISKHDGHITVESEPGAGTTFTMYLPAGEGPLYAERTKTDNVHFTGKGRVLIMDDEASILDIAREMLRQVGYDVEVALNGDEAIEKYRQAIGTGMDFDAVILDLTVPGGTGGRETLRRLLEIDPETRAVVSSGYSNDTAMSNYKEYGFQGVIAKPYKFSEIARVMEDVLKNDGKK